MSDQKTILIIDDDPDIITSLRITLESKKHKVLTALSGEEGLKKFDNEKADLVICDIMMEEITSGFDTAKKIREKDRNVKIYLLSDIGSLTSRNIDPKKIGVTGILQKPIEPNRLLDIINIE